MPSSPKMTKTGHVLAKIFQIDLNQNNPDKTSDPLTRGESVFSVSSADTYVEEEPTTIEWFREVTPNGRQLAQYFISLFPFLNWIGFYNLQWLIGDLVAGITIGAVVVPQGMAYAILAQLPVQFGLYSSFMGVLLYWFFATSKDITIGPVAVMSTVTGNVVIAVSAAIPSLAATPWVIAESLAIITGAIICFIGLIRCGWIVELISLASLTAFMTGSALNIAVGQVPTLMGMSGFSTRDSTYLVVINILKNLHTVSLDAALGLTALFFLYAVRMTLNYLARRYPKKAKVFFFINTLRTVFVILLYTMVSWLVNMNIRAHPKFKILGNVPRGFQYAGVPHVNTNIIRSFASQLPASVIVMVIEHIAIAKSFGRVNNYVINPSQEFVAIGVTNLIGPFLGGYPVTGSFSRTAIKSKAGVRTPFAGVITAIVVLLAIYALPAVFFYIPNAALSAVIIHAVGDLITYPNTLYQFWRVNPLEVVIFFAGVIVTVFTSIEIGIYVTISVSMAVFLFRVLKARGRFMGLVKVHSVIGDHVLNNNGKSEPIPQDLDSQGTNSVRNVFLPIEHNDGSNPQLDVESPYPGIFIYRFSEGFNYPNATHYLDHLTNYIFANTRRGNLDSFGKKGDRPWNEPKPRAGETDPSRPELKAIILDFSSVNNVDITSIQRLIDVRNQLASYALPNHVEWHLACINNRWTKRALASAGFGYPSPADGSHEQWKPIFSVAEIGGHDSAASQLRTISNAGVQYEHDVEAHPHSSSSAQPEKDVDFAENSASSSQSGDNTAKNTSFNKFEANKPRRTKQIAVVHGINRPFFHIDLTSALQSAIASAESRY